jgi:iron(III) transport system substrate-binding protein
LEVEVLDAQGDELVARMSQEFPAGRYSADVLIVTSEMAEAHELGFLEEYEFPGTDGWPDQPSHNFFRRHHANARLFTYNSATVKAEDVPRTYEDLLDPKYQDYKFVVSTSGDDVVLFYASMWGNGQTLDWDRAEDYWGRLIDLHKPTAQRGYSATLELVGAGAFDFFPGATLDDTLRMIGEGAPLAVAPIPQAPGVIEGHVALMKNAPHPNAARLWIDFYNQPTGYGAYVGTLGKVAIQGGEFEELASSNAKMKELGIEFVWLPVDQATVENVQRSSDFIFDKLGITPP